MENRIDRLYGICRVHGLSSPRSHNYKAGLHAASCVPIRLLRKGI